MGGGWRINFGRSRRPESVREFGMYTIPRLFLSQEPRHSGFGQPESLWRVSDVSEEGYGDLVGSFRAMLAAVWIVCKRRPFVTGVFITAHCLNTTFLSPPLFVTIDLFAFHSPFSTTPHTPPRSCPTSVLRLLSWLEVEWSIEIHPVSSNSDSEWLSKGR